MDRIHFIRHPWRGFWTGMLFLAGDGENTLIDTATEGAVERTLEPFLRSAGLSWESLALVINTHSHGDHVDGNREIRERCGARFAIHRAGAEGLRRGGFSPDLELEDGTELSPGGVPLRILHTPGHSPDSICVLERSTGTLFSGDSIQGGGSRNIGIALYSDPAGYRKSMEKLLELCGAGEIRRILCGHPELPLAGEADSPEQAEQLLLASIRAVDAAGEVTEELLRERPDADVAAVRNRLLERCGSTLAPAWPELSFHTAEAHRRGARGGITG